MTLKLRAGTLDVTVRYTLSAANGATHVRRVVTLGIPRSLALVKPLLAQQFRAESARTLLALKAYADRLT
jgi:triacylglycerol esterase/lipase EstA (alpha/beta hydrolase family)